jgi:tetratricopeptide (TPR) repeat protein
MLAYETGSGAIRLVAPDTGREYARLQDPNQCQASWIEFSPDGTQLVTTNGDHEPVHVWDLRAIRAHLARMGLDWDLPPYPPAAINQASEPVQVQLDPGDLMDREKHSLIIAFFPFHAEAYYQRGLACARFFHWEQALTDFTMAAALRPDHAETHYQRGLMHVRQGQSQKAVADFNRAIELRPNYPDAHAGRAEAYAAAQQWDRAIADFSQALKKKGDDPNLWFARGKAYSNLGQWQKASLDFSKTIEGDPDWYEPWHARARAYYGQGEWPKAVADFSKTLELAPWWGGGIVWLERGNTYSALSQWDNALADFSKAIALRPSFAPSWMQRGQAYAELAQWDKADADFAKAQELAPDNLQSGYLRALLLLARGDTQGYHKACATLLESSAPKPMPEADNWVAWTCALLPDAVKELDRPVKLAEGALRSDPKNATYSQTLGAALYRSGRFAEAVQRLEQGNKAWEQAPNNLTSYCPAYGYCFLAMAHLRLDQAREAHEWLDKALRTEHELQNPGVPPGSLAFKIVQDGQGLPRTEWSGAVESSETSRAWNRRFTLQLLRHEAEALVKGKVADQPTPKKQKLDAKASER